MYPEAIGAEGRTILPVQQLQPHGINLTTSMLDGSSIQY